MVLDRVTGHAIIVTPAKIPCMNIVLLGYRGCGKSSIGKRLANELWKDFVDLDDVTRRRLGGLSIVEIWAQLGEEAFRLAEAKAAEEVLKKDDQVVALGGGTVTTQAGKAAVVDAADTRKIYLSCSAEVLAKRIALDATTASERPALMGGSDPIAEVEKVLARRDPIYREVADIVFDVTYCTIDDAVRHLIAKL